MKKFTITLLLALLTTTACVKEEVVIPTRTDTGVAPALVIERFMRALNTEPKDLVTMGQLFGTRDGPIAERDSRALVEQRMFAIGKVLQHDDYQIVREQQVPGRTNEATQLIVQVKSGGRTHNVPFTMVRYKDGAWLIEQIGIEVITNTR